MKKAFLVICVFLSLNTLQAQSWSELGIGSHALNANNYIISICTDKSGNVYASGSFTDTNGYYCVAKWDGVSWSELGALNANGTIWSICADASGNIYAAGSFHDTNGYSYVAKWDGTVWSQLGADSTTPNFYNSGILTIAIDASCNVYAAGQFSDSLIAYKGHEYVAKWNGTTWNELGTGSNALNANAEIDAICVDASGNVYAGGIFTDTSAHFYVAKWDGINWSKLGTGINGESTSGIGTICSDAAGNIYTNGGFADSGYGCVVEFNATSGIWSVLGGVASLKALSGIGSICVDASGNVYTAAVFDSSSIDMNPVIYNAASGTWSELGKLTTNNYIQSICLDTSDNVYAAGDFTDSISSTSGHRYVAKYSNPYAGIKEVGKNNDIKIYPNPANDIITIKITPAMMDADYFIGDMTGKLLFTGVLENTENKVVIESLASGLYFLKIGNTTIQKTYKIIIKE